MSMVTLPTHPNGMPSSNKFSTMGDLEVNGTKTAVTDVKLEPIKCNKLVDMPQKKANGILNLPSENIKSRLSSSSAHSRASGESFSLDDIKEQSSGSEASLDHRENLTGSSEIEKLPSELKTTCNDGSDADTKSHCTHKPSKSDCTETNRLERSRPSSSTKLEKLTTHLDTVIQRSIENGNDEFNSKLGDLCSDVVTNVRVCNGRLEAQKESLKKSNEDTNTILEAFKKTKRLETRLKNSLLSFEDGEMNFVNEILSEELKFQTHSKHDETDRNSNVTKREPRVNSEDKKKLLATLKAIDNGDNFDSLNSSPTHRRTSLTKQIFSDMLK